MRIVFFKTRDSECLKRSHNPNIERNVLEDTCLTLKFFQPCLLLLKLNFHPSYFLQGETTAS